jgi:hypothetical protein
MPSSGHFEDYQIVNIDETGEVMDTSEHHGSADSFLVELDLYKTLSSLHAANYESTNKVRIFSRQIDLYKTLPSFNAASFEVAHRIDLASKLCEAMQDFKFDNEAGSVGEYQVEGQEKCTGTGNELVANLAEAMREFEPDGEADLANDEELEIENKANVEEIQRDPELQSSRSAEENDENKYSGSFLIYPSSKSSSTKEHDPNRDSLQESDDEDRAFFKSQIRLLHELNMTKGMRTTQSSHTDPDSGSKSRLDISQKSCDFNIGKKIENFETEIPIKQPDSENELIFRLARVMSEKEDSSDISPPPAYSEEGSELSIHEEGGDQFRLRAERLESTQLNQPLHSTVVGLPTSLRDYVNLFDEQQLERRVERDEEIGNEACIRREERLEETRQLIMSASMTAAVILLMWTFQRDDV